MKLGDIYLVDLPQIGGREQMGKRPAIIVQEEEYNLPTVADSSTNYKNKGIGFCWNYLDQTRR